MLRNAGLLRLPASACATKHNAAARGHKYHLHLDECVQCERNPWDLCKDGARILRGDVAAIPLEDRPEIESRPRR